jgi:uncharacterized coiled-coil protein SlyX
MAEEHDSVTRETVASLGRRIERLEGITSEQDKKLDRLDFRVASIHDLMELKFTTLATQNETTSRKLDNFMEKIDLLISKGLEQQGDLEATALGRQVSKRLVELEGIALKNTKFRESARGVGYLLSAYILPAVAVTVSLVTAAILFTRV